MATSEIRYRIVKTREGHAALVTGANGILAVILPGLGKTALTREVRRRFPGAVPGERGLKAAGNALVRYFETGREPKGAFRLDLDGVGEFRGAVYEALRGIPAGETITYAELARRIGRPGAHRAVGTALARNPVPVFVPCHRVLRSDGGLGGFTAEGGTELKARMLELESVAGA